MAEGFDTCVDKGANDDEDGDDEGVNNDYL